VYAQGSSVQHTTAVAKKHLCMFANRPGHASCAPLGGMDSLGITNTWLSACGMLTDLVKSSGEEQISLCVSVEGAGLHARSCTPGQTILQGAASKSRVRRTSCCCGLPELAV
jgi:hypothetical protein